MSAELGSHSGILVGTRDLTTAPTMPVIFSLHFELLVIYILNVVKERSLNATCSNS